MFYIKKRKIIALILAIMSILFFSISFKVVAKEEETTGYTDVLEDLQKDETFDISKYPASEQVKVDVIQIAESSDRELFIYVYEPCYKTEKYDVDKIRLGDVEIGFDTEYKDYDLTLLNSNGVFFKYKVEDFTVRESNVRYYDVVSLLYKLAEPYENGLGQTITHKSIIVEQKWEALTFEGKTTYRMEESKTVTITDKVVGFIRYWDGFKWIQSYTDSHFVAFSTDLQIDSLFEASLTFIKKDYEETITYGVSKGRKYSSETLVPIDIFSDDDGENEGNGLFGKKYTWKRIEKVSDFMKSDSISVIKQDLTSLEKHKWVLRFYETKFKDSFMQNVSCITAVEVSDVTILRLKFKTAGKPYNLGVVDNYQTGPDEPSGTVDPEIDLGIDDIWEKIQKIISLVLILVIGGVIVAILSPFIPMIVKGIVLVFSWIIKGICWVICLPFKLIGKLFKRKDKI